MPLCRPGYIQPAPPRDIHYPRHSDPYRQIYNHNLYWNSLSPTGGGMPTGDLYTAIVSAFGSYEEFQTAFTGYASGHFGSGWAGS